MPLFDVGNQDQTDPTLIANRMLYIGNVQFQRELTTAYQTYNDMWNRGEGQPTGQDILVGMGTSAQMAMAAAWSRVQMLVSIATAIGQPELVDLTKLLPPVELSYNLDGSIDI